VNPDSKSRTAYILITIMYRRHFKMGFNEVISLYVN
jgi:hypothetical protein